MLPRTRFAAAILLLVLVISYAGLATLNWGRYKALSGQHEARAAQLDSELSTARTDLYAAQASQRKATADLDSCRTTLATTQTKLIQAQSDLQRQKDLAQTYKEQADDLSAELLSSKTSLQTCVSDVYYTMNYSYAKSSPLGFKLLCAEGFCTLPEETLDPIFYDMERATLSLNQALGVDIHDYFRSVEVHATSDSFCMSEGGCAYASIFGYSTGLPRGLICFDAPGCESSPAVFTHEMSHNLWWYQEIPQSFNEGFASVMEAIVAKEKPKGIAGYIESLLFPSPTSMCDLYFHNPKFLIERSRYVKGMELFYQLCQRHGFDMDDWPAFFDLAEEQPGYHTDYLSFEEIISLFSQITGQDVKPTIDEIISIPTEGAVCGNGKCDVDEWFYCRKDCQ